MTPALLSMARHHAAHAHTAEQRAAAADLLGDLEGARELLGEVVAEGPPDLAGDAREILARIG